MKHLIYVVIAFSSFISSCLAQQIVPAEDIIESLKASASPSAAVSASDVVQSLKAQIAVVPRESNSMNKQLDTPQLDAMATLNIEIFFEYNSDVVMQKSLPALVQLGSALVANELSSSNFLVIGHTDSKGDREYNIKLSERRAVWVRNFLENNFPTSKDRLSSIGLGEEKLRNTAEPESEENRRVQIVNLGFIK